MILSSALAALGYLETTKSPQVSFLAHLRCFRNDKKALIVVSRQP